MPEGDPRPQNSFVNFMHAVFDVVDKPVTVFKENVVDRLKTKNPPVYYHRKYRRIQNIDECEIGDNVCFYETNEQFKRDRRVESEILNILKERRLECEHFYGVDSERMCTKVRNDFITAETNWFTKYGDLGARGSVLDAYMKQKHRLIWERRHGEVGTGMKTKPFEYP